MKEKIHPLRAIRARGVPLCCFETADPAQTIRGCCAALNGKIESTPIMQWTFSRGLEGLNSAGKQVADTLSPNGAIDTGNPAEAILKLQNTPDKSLVFIHTAGRILNDPSIIQGIWLLRDTFKANGSTLVLLTPAVTLPEELKQDVVVISEPLPDQAEIEAIVDSICRDAGLPDPANKPKVVDTLLGLSSFAAEQAVALSLSKDGVDIESLLGHRRSFVSQTAGLEIRTDKLTFADIAGYETVKSALTRKIGGQRPPRLVIWLEELEKAFGASMTDSSGVSQDQVGTLLTWFQDKLNADLMSAMLLVGFPGTGKSAIAMATHNEAQCECVRMDIGAMKGSLVGESERKIRQALKTVDAICKGHILCLATCNSIANIPSAFVSRFAFGTYFFNLPVESENKIIWELKRKKYSIADADEAPPSLGWTGREIQQCCFLANDLRITLKEAAQYIAPFCLSGRKEIDSLRGQADGRWISASEPGIFNSKAASKSGRVFDSLAA